MARGWKVGVGGGVYDEDEEERGRRSREGMGVGKGVYYEDEEEREEVQGKE